MQNDFRAVKSEERYYMDIDHYEKSSSIWNNNMKALAIR